MSDYILGPKQSKAQQANETGRHQHAGLYIVRLLVVKHCVPTWFLMICCDSAFVLSGVQISKPHNEGKKPANG